MKERYESYKDSGVPWIGQVPAGWEVETFGKHFTFGKGLPITKADLVPEGIAVLSYGQIHAKYNRRTTISDNMVRFVLSDFISTNPKSLLNKGDFVFADTSEDIDGSGNFGFNDYADDIFAGYHTIIARPIDLAYPKYYAYLFQSRGWKSQVQSKVNGVKVYSISKEILKGTSILLPPLPIQRAIADYLDERCAAIDAYVASLEREAGLARELKQAVIARAVTRGLDPNTPMRDSGIPWIGQVPQGWEVRRTKYLAELYTGESIKDSEKNNYTFPEDAHPYISSKDINLEYNTIDYENGMYIKNGDRSFSIAKKGSTLMCIEGGSAGRKKARLNQDVSFVNKLCCYAPLNIDGSYLFYFLCSSNFEDEFKRNISGLIGGVPVGILKNIKIPLPPLPEQRAIADYLDARCAAIDAYVASIEREATLARELKQREIADAVTGKVRVAG